MMKKNENNVNVFYKDCDLITGKNTDNIKYDMCVECYRYDICKKAFNDEEDKH